MKKLLFSFAIVAALIAGNTHVANAQCSSCGGGSGIPDNADSTGIGLGVKQCRWPASGNREFTNGNTNVACPVVRGLSYSNAVYRSGLALRDRNYHPAPFYAYSRNGIDSARMDQWNRVRSQQTAWHGGHNYWRFNAPTALVVPPTAAFQTSYSWGVGGTKSLPINHQFNSFNPGGSGGISQQFSNPPYWPSSTEQMGVYPVRAPWSHVR